MLYSIPNRRNHYIKTMRHYGKVKFYRKKYDNLNNDIHEIYFDDNYLYVENVVRICYINNDVSILLSDCPK